MKKTLSYLRTLKANGERVAMITGYDYPTAVLEEEAGVDVILVGDSLGTNMLGYASEREVTLADMVHHTRAVKRGVKSAYLLVDLPYRTYETPEQALASSRELVAAGADGVKLEGALPEIVRHLVLNGVEVCGHLGYLPQTADGPGLRAKTAAAAAALINDSLALEEAGAGMIVYELIPEEVAKEATSRLKIPTIGIGAGRYVDGQVLLCVDLLGVTPIDFIHNKKFRDLRQPMLEGYRGYVSAVKDGTFPEEGNTRRMPVEELNELLLGIILKSEGVKLS